VQTLPRLEPLPLSWMVSPSVPFLKVSAAESDEAQTPTTVELFATYSDGHVSRVRLVFRFGTWVRWSPAHADLEPVPKGDYDWSGVPEPSPGPGFYESFLQERRRWAETGICPNPYIYEVHESLWLRKVNARETIRDRLRHYLILGHDAYVEVLAEGWHEEELTPPVEQTEAAEDATPK
jgi:hypothetical protein